MIDAADILKRFIRKSDVIARIGGDEFVALIVMTINNLPEILAERLDEGIRIYNAERTHGFNLSLSIGFAYYDPATPCSIEELLDRADKNMYEQKQKK